MEPAPVPSIPRDARRALMERLRYYGVPDPVIGVVFGVRKQRVGVIVGALKRSPVAQERFVTKRFIIEDGLRNGKTLVQIAGENDWSYSSVQRFAKLHSRVKPRKRQS